MEMVTFVLSIPINQYCILNNDHRSIQQMAVPVKTLYCQLNKNNKNNNTVLNHYVTCL